MIIHLYHHAVRKIWLFTSQMELQPKHNAYFYQRNTFIIISQIANNLRFISSLQYRLSNHPPLSPCCEEELTILSSDEMQPKHKISYINRRNNLITTSQIANNFRFISNLQYRLSEPPPSSPCHEEELAILFSVGATVQSYFY